MFRFKGWPSSVSWSVLQRLIVVDIKWQLMRTIIPRLSAFHNFGTSARFARTHDFSKLRKIYSAFAVKRGEQFHFSFFGIRGHLLPRWPRKRKKHGCCQRLLKCSGHFLKLSIMKIGIDFVFVLFMKPYAQLPFFLPIFSCRPGSVGQLKIRAASKTLSPFPRGSVNRPIGIWPM